MRSDAKGLFWHDEEKVKPPKQEKIKRTPPARTWEAPDYLPHLQEALAFDVPLFTDERLAAAALAQEELVFDVESFPNYFLVAFKSVQSGLVTYFEITDDELFSEEAIAKLQWALGSFVTCGFNSLNYDVPMLAVALAGYSAAELKEATNAIIYQETRPGDLVRAYKVKPLLINHIDLIEVAPLSASLKIYGGRLHTKRMQDLPFPAETVLSDEQKKIVRLYCINDLDQTILLRKELSEQITLREKLSAQYGADLRSKSDAQVAETVIIKELTKLNGYRPRRQNNEELFGTIVRYTPPLFLRYQTPLLKSAVALIASLGFKIDASGSPATPQQLDDLSLTIGNGVYRLGIGGLHSSEANVAHVSDEEFILKDFDVASYYPQIILNLGLFPGALGINFLRVYRGIVDSRLVAKAAGEKSTAASLKIVVNGTFGKFGNLYSILYAPQLMLAVTLTGQLSVLMLIERLELAGIPIVSGNTDGVVVRCLRKQEAIADAIIKQWEYETGFQTEATIYKGLYCRDVNNYVAVKTNGECKVKGIFSEKGSALDSVLSKNPENLICSDAVKAMLSKGTPVEQTIRACKDIRRFVTVRSVKGGAVKDGVYLGRAIRWIHAIGATGETVYARTGNKVPRTDGSRPLMDLPDELPADLDFDWYIAEATKLLREIAFLPSEPVPEVRHAA